VLYPYSRLQLCGVRLTCICALSTTVVLFGLLPAGPATVFSVFLKCDNQAVLLQLFCLCWLV
jgi:hypothetical protein